MLRTISSYLSKLRTWGLKGAWDFAVGKVWARRWRRFFLDNAALPAGQLHIIRDTLIV